MSRLALVLACSLLAACPTPLAEPDACPPAQATARASRAPAGAGRFVTGALGCLGPGAPAEAAAAWATGRAGGGPERLVPVATVVDELGLVHVRLEEQAWGLPVAGATLVVHAEAATGAVYAVHGRFAPTAGAAQQPRLDGYGALAEAAFAAGLSAADFLDEPALGFAIAGDGAVHLAWSGRLHFVDAGGDQVERWSASATDGALVARTPVLRRARQRRVHAAGEFAALPGRLLGDEHGPTGDLVARAAHEHLGTVHAYLADRLGRDSYDGAGAPLVATVHFTADPAAAMWTGEQVVFGDGDGVALGPPAAALDVVAHELGHALVEHTAGLAGHGEPGAIDEAMADVLGAAVEAWAAGAVGPDTWRIGERVFTPGVAGDALRYLDDPAADGASCDHYAERGDAGDVHATSGIARLAFHLLAAGGRHPRGKSDVEVPGLGFAAAEHIFLRALTLYMDPGTDFAAARLATRQAAADLYGDDAAAAVELAWDAVGVPREQVADW